MKLKNNLKEEITPELVYKNRRRIIKSFFINSAFAKMFLLNNFANGNDKLQVLNFIRNKKFSTPEKKTNFKAITTYNNFYEFGTDKKDPKKKSKNFTTTNWILEITGNVKKAKKFSLEDLLKISTLEERVLRLRCVETWSMVIPWIGYSLSTLLRKVEILGNAKYVKFTSVLRPEQMPGQKFPVLDWPYIEGLRIDEAMHPLTTLVLGLYGQLLPNQNGAPLRLIVPWKYGFKSPKSLVKIDLVEEKPITSWVSSSPREYGFFSNVNPNVNHPRWSQNKERRIGEFRKRKTRLFNGYEEDVANLYSNMDLNINF